MVDFTMIKLLKTNQHKLSLIFLLVLGLCFTLNAKAQTDRKPSSLQQTLKSSQSFLVVIFYQSNVKKYNEFVSLLEKTIKIRLPKVSLIKVDVNQYDQIALDNFINEINKKRHGFISVGKIATNMSLSLRLKVKQLCLFLSKPDLDSIYQNYKTVDRDIGGLYEEQSFQRQLLLAKSIKPKLDKVSLLFKQNDKTMLPEYMSLLEKHKIAFDFTILKLTEPATSYFKRIVDKGDIFFVSNNRLLYNSNHLKSLVLAAHKKQAMLIGSRIDDVKLGCLAAVYTPIENYVEELLTELEYLLINNKVNPPRFSNHFSVELNQRKVQSLQLDYLSKDLLIKNIKLMEKDKSL
jgi:hypothetical protein